MEDSLKSYKHKSDISSVVSYSLKAVLCRIRQNILYYDHIVNQRKHLVVKDYLHEKDLDLLNNYKRKYNKLVGKEVYKL